MSVVEVVHRNSLLNSKFTVLLSTRQIPMSNNKKNKILMSWRFHLNYF